MRLMVSITSAVALAVGAAAATSQAASIPVLSILGAWYWQNANVGNPGYDTSIYQPDGGGAYLRRGELCYRFTYKLVGDVLQVTALTPNSCGLGLVHRYKIRVSGGTLTMQHIPTGFTSYWTRVRPEGPLQSGPAKASAA